MKRWEIQEEIISINFYIGAFGEEKSVYKKNYNGWLNSCSSSLLDLENEAISKGVSGKLEPQLNQPLFEVGNNILCMYCVFMSFSMSDN